MFPGFHYTVLWCSLEIPFSVRIGISQAGEGAVLLNKRQNKIGRRGSELSLNSAGGTNWTVATITYS